MMSWMKKNGACLEKMTVKYSAVQWLKVMRVEFENVSDVRGRNHHRRRRQHRRQVTKKERQEETRMSCRASDHFNKILLSGFLPIKYLRTLLVDFSREAVLYVKAGPKATLSSKKLRIA